MRKLLVAIFSLVALAFAQSANADSIRLSTINSSGQSGSTENLILGEVFVPGDLSGGQVTRDTAAVNLVLDLALGGYSGQTDPSYWRSTNDFGALPDAVTAGAQVSGASLIVSGTLASLTLSQTYQYLVVTYDGPNGGAIVWYTGGFGANTTLEFARYAYPTGTGEDQHIVENTSGTRYGITHWTLLNPTGPVSVPDGGATAVLLGLSMLGLGVARRRKS
jgi:hypothetical protein